jgi:2-polyprenyl-3-methyl-5-hydroxy-6-metoxy-1,4-benzoquinol methylase
MSTESDMGDWDDCAATWDENQSVQEYGEKAFQSLTGHVDVTSVHSLLDFGCGTGQLTDKFASSCSRIVAIDASKAMIEVLEGKGYQNVTTVGDFLTPELLATNPCFHEKFDVIVASSVCSFLPNYEETLLLLRSLLKPTGQFIQWDWLSDEFSKNRVENAMSAAGFVQVETSEPFSMEAEGSTMQVLMGVGTA